MSRLNLEMFRKVKERILAEPEFVNMADYLVVRTPDKGKGSEICGTVGCIAGHACLADFGRQLKIVKRGSRAFPYFDHEVSGISINPHEEGMRILGLTGNQADVLFTSWPSYISRETPGTRQYAKAVVRWIDEFIDKADSYAEDEDEDWDEDE